MIVLVPPRKVCDKKLLDTAVSANPEKIVYVSCNAATLARNLKMLRELGYEPKSTTGGYVSFYRACGSSRIIAKEKLYAQYEIKTVSV